MSPPKTAIITGGAGGLGQALDHMLRGRGWFTVLLDLPGPALDELPDLPDRMVIACDLTDDQALAQACDAIRAARPTIDLAIYNAGVTHIGLFDDSSDAVHRRVFEINYFAAVNMARLLLRDIRASHGTHLAISSVAGFSPLFQRTAYAASKHALEGFFKSLRSEEKAHDVRCIIAAPSFVATNPGATQTKPDGTSRPGAATDGIDYMSAADAAAVILAGYDRAKPFIPVGRVAVLSHLINRLSPALFQRIMERSIK